MARQKATARSVLASVLAIMRLHGKPLGQILARLQTGFLVIAGVGFVVWGGSLLSGGAVPPWLAWKMVLFGAIFFVAIGIDIGFRPVGPAFGRLAAEGSTPDVEAAIRRPIDATLVIVTTLYLLLLAISFLGSVKPDLSF